MTAEWPGSLEALHGPDPVLLRSDWPCEWASQDETGSLSPVPAERRWPTVMSVPSQWQCAACWALTSLTEKLKLPSALT